jgi:hypothetical protein
MAGSTPTCIVAEDHRPAKGSGTGPTGRLRAPRRIRSNPARFPRRATGPVPPAADGDQTWNELPQPQLLTTLGLLKTNPRFSRPS